MFKNILQAVFSFSEEKLIPVKIKLFSDFMLTHRVVRTVNECDEDVYIAIEKEQERNLDILVTKCKRLLSFVEGRGLESKYTHILIEFGNEIENHVQMKMNIDHLFSKFEAIKKEIKIHSMSNVNLSDINNA